MISMALQILAVALPLLISSYLLVFCKSKKRKSSSPSVPPSSKSTPPKDPLKTVPKLEANNVDVTAFPYKDDENEEEKKEPLVSVGPKDTLEFPFGSTSQQKMTIKNVSKQNAIFMVQLSSPAVYRSAPIFGILAPNATVNVIVTRTPSKEKKEEKLVVVNSEAPKEVKEKDLESVFKTLKPTGGNVEVKLKTK
ncbi:unnamed protein product [Caenorhabditis sp. 36 PRJEB53466]|nr:unnamed protein product [Caenorhabditis sp. 36 PRJEB53466]